MGITNDLNVAWAVHECAECRWAGEPGSWTGTSSSPQHKYRKPVRAWMDRVEREWKRAGSAHTYQRVRQQLSQWPVDAWATLFETGDGERCWERFMGIAWQETIPSDRQHWEAVQQLLLLCQEWHRQVTAFVGGGCVCRRCAPTSAARTVSCGPMLIAVRRQVIPAMFHLAIQSALKGVLPDAAGSISQWTLQTLLLFTADDAPHASLEADAFATGAWLQRTAVALTCYLRDRDAASLQVLLDQAVLPAKQGCGTATRCPTVTGPASRSLAVLGSCGDHADTCWEHQVDVCVASMLSICAALLQAAHLPETHRQELLARLARHACSAPSSPSHVRAAATVVSLARDRFIASLIRSIGRQGAVAVAAVRLQWMQTALPLGVVERHASLLVQTLCQYIKPLSLLRRDDALVLLADALESATFRDALTPPDIEAFLLVAVCALLQPDQADHRGHPLWQAAPGRILEAIAPRVLSSAYRTLLLTFVVRHRCAAAVPTVLTGGGRTAAADMVRVAVAYLRAASATGTAPAKNAMVDPPWPTTPESTHTRAVLSTMTRAAHQFLDTWAPSSSATDSPAPTRATTPAIERAHSLMAWTLSALCTVDVGNTLDVRFPADETWMTLVPSAVIGDTLSRVRVNTQQVLGAAVRQSDEAAQQHQHTIRALHHQIHALQQRLAQLERDHRNLEQATACVVCFEPLREPMALSPCGHVLCRACLQALLRGDATPACPTCRSAIAPDRVLPLHWL